MARVEPPGLAFGEAEDSLHGMLERRPPISLRVRRKTGGEQVRRVRSSGANRPSILAMEYYAPVMDALMGHFVYIRIFMHLVDVQASIRIYRMVMLRIRHNIMQRQSGDGRYWEQEKCGDQDDTHLSCLRCPLQRPKPRRSGVPVDWTMGQFYRLSLHAGVVRAVGADALEPVAPTKNGRRRAWLRIKNPASPAMQRVWEDRFC